MSKAGTRVLIGLGGVMAGVYLAPFALVAGIVVLVGRALTAISNFEFEFDEVEIVSRFLILFSMIMILYFCFKALTI